MPIHLLTLKTPVPYHGPSLLPISPQSPRLAHPIIPPTPRSVLSCRGVGIQVSPPEHGSGSKNGVVQQDWKLRGVGVKDIDVATLGNLCVDIVLSVPKLPPKKLHDRKAYMDRLSASPPDKVRVSVLCCQILSLSILGVFLHIKMKYLGSYELNL